MTAKRPPAIQKKWYIEIDYEWLKETGELRALSEPLYAPTVVSQVPRGKFEITYTGELFNILEKLGNKKISVFSFLLSKKDGNNCINMTNVQIANELKISRPTVIDTLKALEEADLIKRENSLIMISPALIVKGNQQREAYLMRKFEEIPDKNTLQSNLLSTDNAVDATVNGQLEYDMDGNIIERAK